MAYKTPVALLALLIPALASGETDRDIDETITVVGTRTERAIDEVAATVSVKTAEEIEEQLVRDIQDLVRFEPGVTVGGTGERFGLGGFNIRGIGGNRVLTIVDGIRVPDEFSFGPFLSSRRDFVDVDSLDRVEIARGPISSLYGSDALGGVVAFETKGPGDYLQGGQFHAGFKAGYSGADQSTVGTASLAGGNDIVSGMLLYTKRDASETETAGSIGGTGPAREIADPQAMDLDNVITEVTFAPAENHEFTLGISHYDNDTDTRVLSDYGTLSRGTLVNTRDAFDTRERTRYSLEYEWNGQVAFADRVRATLYRQESNTRQLTLESRTTPSGAAQSRERTSVFEQDINGALVIANKTFEAGKTRHVLSYGIDYYVTDSQSLRDGGTTDAAGDPVFEFFPLPTRDFPTTEVTQFAVFVQDEITLADGRLRLSPGLRYDEFDAAPSADDIFLTGNPGSPDPEAYADAEVTAKVGAVYEASDAVSLYAHVAQGFRAPPYDDVNVGFTNFIGGYKSISSPNLESETSTGIEIGARFDGRAGFVKLTAFHNDYDNFIEALAISPQFASTGGIDPADGLLTFQSINRESVEIEGAEMSAVADLDALGAGLPGLRLRASIAWAQGEDTATGAPLNSIQPLTGVFGLAYDDTSGRWGGQLIWTLVASKEAGDIDGDERMPTAGYGTVDLLARYAFSERMQVNLGLFNLGDKRHLRWIDTTGIGVDAPARFTQPGFNVAATLRMAL